MRPRERFAFDVCSGDMNQRAYVALVTFLTMLDLGIFVAAAKFVGDERFGLGIYLVIIGIALGAIILAAVAVANEADALAFITTSLAAGLLGLLCGPLMAQHNLGSTLRIFSLVLIIVAVLGTIGVLIPRSLGGLSGILIGSTLILVAISAMIGVSGVGYANALTGIDIIFMVVFGMWVVFDFNQLYEYGRTPAAAAYVGLGIFMDIVNLFIWIGESIKDIDWPKPGTDRSPGWDWPDDW